MVKYTKQTKEQFMGYLEKYGSSLSEAAKIAGTTRVTLTRHLEKGVIPSEWYAKITTELKNRKPALKSIKAETRVCSGCGKKVTVAIGKDIKLYNCDAESLKGLGVAAVPTSGWHWFTNTRTGAKTKMYPICEKCWNKLEEIRIARKKTIKGKVTTKPKK